MGYFVGVKFRKEKGGYKESILSPAQNAFDIVPIGESPAICGWLSFFFAPYIHDMLLLPRERPCTSLYAADISQHG